MTQACSNAFSVLLVEDNPHDALLLQECVKDQSRVTLEFKHVTTLRSALDRLEHASFDIVLLDLSLPDSFGLESLSRMREHAPTTPVIVLTGNENDSIAIEALKLGAEDYLTKDGLEASAIARAVQYASERHQTTRRIRELNVELRVELRRRLEELSEAQAKAVQSERLAALGILAGGVAHELNNPLMGVINHIQYALKQLTPEQERANTSLCEALKYSRRCAEIVRDLLSFSRQGTLVHMEEGLRGDANEAVRLALSDAKEAIAAHGVQLRVQLREGLPKVAIDESRLRQVVLNIVRNACQAMESSEERRVVCKTVQGEAEVTIFVGDTGPGMDEATCARIFEMFYSTKAQGKGTGIGLALCRNLVDSVGGRIEVESAPGKGTVFAISVPAAEVAKGRVASTGGLSEGS